MTLYLSIFCIYSRQEGVNSVLNVKAVVAAFNLQEKAQEGAFSVIVQLRRLIVSSTSLDVY